MNYLNTQFKLKLGSYTGKLSESVREIRVACTGSSVTHSIGLITLPSSALEAELKHE